MGVFKWLRRERITVSRCSLSPAPQTPEQPTAQTKQGTIRTEEYKRDLAEFQARRSSGNKDLLETPIKKAKCGRHSLPCTGCTTSDSPDKSFNYEKKSANKFRKNKERRSQEESCEQPYDVPNVQFLFQNQVFMPGNVFPASYSEPQRSKRYNRSSPKRSPDFSIQKQLDFDEEGVASPPLFYKNNSLPYDVKRFLGSSKDSEGSQIANIDISSQSDDVDSPNKSSSCEDNLKEVMTELKNLWADNQSKLQLSNTMDGNKSDTSIYGLPVVELNELDLEFEKKKQWNIGKWSSMPIRIKKLAGISMEQVRKKQNVEIEILKKFRHPNIILLMGFYPDVHQNIYLICEYFLDTLFDVLHLKGSILTVQKSVEYANDIASALLFLQMHGFVHTEINSAKIVITHHDAAKLADLSCCAKYAKRNKNIKCYDGYSLEPQYVNIDTSSQMLPSDAEPLITQRSSDVYLDKNAIAKPYYVYKDSEYFRWQAPELFQPDDEGNVYVCAKSDVYSLCLLLWECCNASIPWKRFIYNEIKDLYIEHNTGLPLPNDGTYPGTLLELLKSGLNVYRSDRIDLYTLAQRLQVVKKALKDMPEIIIPSSQKRFNLNTAWDSTTPSESDAQSPISQMSQLKAMVHESNENNNQIDKETQAASDEIYEVIYNEKQEAEKCFVFDDGSPIPNLQFLQLQDNCPSSACSTPISKVTSRIRNIGTPGRNLHRSDSTEYCSILSANHTNLLHTDTSDNHSTTDCLSAKFSKSFTPKSYKPLHIKVPEVNNLDGIKTLRRNKDDSNMASSYSFDIKNYSLPNTPIARSNKLRKNAWLSGEIKDKGEKGINDVHEQESTPTPRKNDSIDTEQYRTSDSNSKRNSVVSQTDQRVAEDRSVGSDSIPTHERCLQWPCGSGTMQSANSYRSSIDEDTLANMSVKPLVAIHERWIFEANKKNERSMSLPEDTRAPGFRFKAPSRRIEALQHSLPQLFRRSSYDTRSTRSNATSKLGGMTTSRDFSMEDVSKVYSKTPESQCEKTDQATDTRSIEEFIKDLIRKEFNQMMDEVVDDASTMENIVNRGTANVLDALNTKVDEKKVEPNIQSFSRIKINGNDKPLLRITFSNKGENCLEVLDNCVNVTFGDTSGKENRDDTSAEHGTDHTLKRCQGFSALQSARSTEDLYIDDDISTQMQENFGGKVKLIPLHGSLHEILCEREDDCCLLKVKQENGCDTIYFKCDNSDTESRDALDGKELPQDTVVYKRSISLIEERIQRVLPKNRTKDKIGVANARPKSEIFEQNTFTDLKVMSNSTPSLSRKDDEVEVNLEAMSYESSSDECLTYKVENDEFELIERKIEEDVKISSLSNFGCGCLEKISEENLSLLNEDYNLNVKNHGV